MSPKPNVPLPIKILFTNWPLLVVSLSYMCFAYIGWLFLFWFPTYLVEARGFGLATMGTIGIFVHGGGFIGLVGGGVFADYLLRQGWSVEFARLRLGGIGVGLAVPCLLSAALVSSPLVCVILLVFFYALFTIALSGFSTVAIEFNPNFAGAIFGLINTLGTFAGFLGPLSAGYMLAGAGGNWLLPFFVASGVGVVCSALLFMVPIRPIVWEPVASSSVPAARLG